VNRLEEVLDMDDPEDLVDRSADDGNARVLGRHEHVREDRHGRGPVNPQDVRARRHDLAHARVAEVHDREEELLLLLLEDSLFPAHVDVGLDLPIRRQRRLVARAVLEDPAHRDRERRQQPRGRRDEGQEPRRQLLRIGHGAVPQQEDLRQEPAQQEGRPSPGPVVLDAEAAEGRDDGQETQQQEDLHEDLRGRAQDLDLSRPRQEAGMLRVLLEKTADLDRREPVERDRERLEENEQAVTDGRRDQEDHAASAG
jgi:hypothetical protein